MLDTACAACANPLMRTPRNQEPVQIICVNCGEQREDESASQLPSSSTFGGPVSSSRSSISEASNSLSSPQLSTPATDAFSQVDDPILPLLNTEELVRRRTQGDQASAEIGRR